MTLSEKQKHRDKQRRLSRKSFGPLTLDKENFETTTETSFVQKNDTLEKERLQRKSKKLRRASLTPNTKKRQYIKDMYATIIQMSSENKINQKNTWSLPLIDHMGDILDEKRLPQREQSDFNFQKASCTLEASVKIYSHRVDDTWKSSYQILENLTQSDAKVGQEELKEKKTSKKHCVTETLETNVNNINLRSLDLDFQIDPLFHKMSQNFDEGGAKGMLLVNLNVHNGCNLVLDSMEYEDDISARDNDRTSDAPNVNVNALINGLAGACPNIRDMPMCPKLEVFYASRDQLASRDTSTIKASVPGDSILDSTVFVEPDTVLQTEVDEHFDAHSVGDIDNDDILDDDPAQSPVDSMGISPVEEADVSFVGGFGASDEDNFGASDDFASTMPNARTSPSSFDKVLFDSLTEEGDDYSFFNTKLLGGWAGPEHWKFLQFKKKRAKAAPTENQKSQDSVSSDSPKQRTKQLVVDFMSDDSDEDENLFRKPQQLASLQYTSTTLKKFEQSAGSLLLPDDHHYSIQQLVSLFTHPLKRLRSTNSSQNAVAGAEFEVVDDDDYHSTGFDGMDDEEYDGGLSLDVGDLIEPERQVKKIDIKYENKAKRVDVKNLKTNIWAELKDSIVKVEEEEEENDRPVEARGKEICEKPAVEFDRIMDTVAEASPSSASVSFYFICLLHLANEKNLELVGQSDMSNILIRSDPAESYL